MTKASTKYSPEVRERAVRMVLEHQGDHASQWAAISSIAAKIGCTAETLRGWVRQAERDQGLRAGPTSEGRGGAGGGGRDGGRGAARRGGGGGRIKPGKGGAGGRRRANEFLRRAPAFFPRGELARRSKP